MRYVRVCFVTYATTICYRHITKPVNGVGWHGQPEVGEGDPASDPGRQSAFSRRQAVPINAYRFSRAALPRPVAGPGPIFRPFDQTPPHGVAVDIVDLLMQFPNRPDVPIIAAAGPVRDASPLFLPRRQLEAWSPSPSLGLTMPPNAANQ